MGVQAFKGGKYAEALKYCIISARASNNVWMPERMRWNGGRHTQKKDPADK